MFDPAPAETATPAPTPVWASPEGKELAKAMWQSRDCSATEIADKLGTTRSAVCGWMHRNGVEGGLSETTVDLRRRKSDTHKREVQRAKGARKRERVQTARASLRAEQAAAAAARRELDEKVRAEREEREMAEGLRVAQASDLYSLPPRTCSWPLGEVNGEHRFCGEPVMSRRSSYCACHQAVSRIPTPPVNERQFRFFATAGTITQARLARGRGE